jgi:hypothetical protein
MTEKPLFQERHHDYVLGPNQDARLTSVAAGQTIEKVKLTLDPDAPFALRGRAVRQKYSATLTQAGLAGIATQWAGPAQDYRMLTFIPERLQMANYGQAGNPGVIFPQIVYPANGVIQIDVTNTGASAVTNLTFFWRGVKLFPWGAVPGYTYPRKLSALSFSYPILVNNLGVSEIRPNQIFTVKGDADFVIRAGQATAPFQAAGPRTLAEVSFVLRDFNKKPYSNDYVPLDILFGSAAWPDTIPLGPTPSFVAPFSTGPSQPGLYYPEIYVPKNHQMIYDIQRADGHGLSDTNTTEDVYINLIGSKVFAR